VVLLGILVLLLIGSGWAYMNRRNLADSWRQRQVAAIPAPPGVTVPAPAPESESVPAADTAPAPAAEVDPEPSSPPALSPEPEISEPETPAPKTQPTDETPAADEPPAADQPSEGNQPPAVDSTPASQPPPAPTDFPKEANLNVPMVYQAPFNIWDAEHDDACEEASALMLQSYWAGELSLTRQEMEDRIFDLIDYQMEAFGYFEDTDAAETLQFMRDHLGMTNLAILPVNTLDDIRRQIAAGRPVILPADGKALQNPNFRNGGPPYHMFVVKGYTETHFIVNDPGTRRGANWLYSNEIIDAAVHDWNDGVIKNGERVMIVAW
jgi:hypothetical protein